MDPRDELKSSFVTGIVLLTPLAVTVFVVRFAFSWIAGQLNPVVEGTRLVQLTGNNELLAQVLAAVLVAACIVVLGFLAQRSVGRLLFGGLDRAVGLVPLVNTVYASVQQVGDALVSSESRFDRVVYVEYPRDGVYALAFVTADGPPASARIAGEDTYAVFVPNSPNPTGGRLIVVPESELHEADMSVRRAVRLVVTTGIADTQADLEAYQRDPTDSTAEA